MKKFILESIPYAIGCFLYYIGAPMLTIGIFMAMALVLSGVIGFFYYLGKSNTEDMAIKKIAVNSNEYFSRYMPKS